MRQYDFDKLQKMITFVDFKKRHKKKIL